MNNSRSFEERWSYLKSCEPIKLNNEWVQAFIDGEGCFHISIYKNNNKIGWAVKLIFWNSFAC